jgi:heme A synthase
MTRYQKLTLLTVFATLVLIGVGSTVRTTGSGLGCPDWPLCHGRLLPPMEKTSIIEYSHRTTASVVGLLVVLTALVTFRVRPHDRAIRWLAVASLPLLAIQAWLGKVTVERELPPEVVAFHLSMALLLLAVLSTIAAFAILGSGRQLIRTPERAWFLRVAAIATVATAVVVVAGTYVVGSAAGYACTSWPGCSQAAIPFVDGGRMQSIQWLHRLVVLVGAAAVAWVVYTVWTMHEAGEWLRRGAYALGALFALQILSGGLNIWSHFSEGARVLHLVLGSTTWAVLFVLAVAGRYRRGEEMEAAPSAAPVREAGRAGV